MISCNPAVTKCYLQIPDLLIKRRSIRLRGNSADFCRLPKANHD